MTETTELPKPTSITLDINSRLIHMATQANSSKCMIAQAIRRVGGSSTNVTAESVKFNLDGFRYTYPLPAKAAYELLKFDQDKNLVKPFKLVLDGRVASVREVIYRPKKPRDPNKPVRPYKKREVKVTNRRYHGLRTIEAVDPFA